MIVPQQLRKDPVNPLLVSRLLLALIIISRPCFKWKCALADAFWNTSCVIFKMWIPHVVTLGENGLTKPEFSRYSCATADGTTAPSGGSSLAQRRVHVVPTVCLRSSSLPSLSHSLSFGSQYTPIYLPQASAVSPSVSAIRALLWRKAWHLCSPKNRSPPQRTSASFCWPPRPGCHCRDPCAVTAGL